MVFRDVDLRGGTHDHDKPPGDHAYRPDRAGRRRTRQWLLLAHLVGAGGWIGVDVVLALFVLVALTTGDPTRRAMASQALGVFAIWPLFTMSLICLLSGLLLGLTSRYGLVRFWWLTIKLALNLLLSTLILVLLRPGVTDLAAAGRALTRDEVVDPAFASSMVYPPIVSLTTLLAAAVLAVFKPWGRTPWSRPVTR